MQNPFRKSLVSIGIAYLLLLFGCGPEPEPAKPKPTVDFLFTISNRTVMFTNLSLNAATYNWTFGDGSNSTAENPSHTYVSDGTFTVVLKATGAGGSALTTKSVTVTGSSGTTSGSAMFWIKSDLGCGNISVTLNGATKTITGFNTAGDPACGTANSANFTLVAGSYNYTATCTGKTFSGTVNITANVCSKIEFVNSGGGTTSTISFANKTYTTMTITFDGVTKDVDPGGTGVFTGTPNSTATGSAFTFGRTTSGTQVGSKLTWNLSNTYPATGNLTTNLNVDAEYFMIYITNSSSKEISKVYVNHGLQSETLDNLSLPNNGTKYRIGYYKAFSNSNVRLESGTSFWTWTSANLALPFTVNQSVSLVAN